MDGSKRWRSWLIGTASLALVAVTFLGLQIGYGLGLVNYLGQPATPGEFGEMFGGYASFVGGLTLVLVVYSILLQRSELALQREELKLQREEMRQQKEAIDHTRMYQAEPVLVPDLEAHEWIEGSRAGGVEFKGVLNIENTGQHAAWQVEVWTGLHPLERDGAEGSGRADIMLPGQARHVRVQMSFRGPEGQAIRERLVSHDRDERPLLFTRLRYRNMGGGIFESWRGIRLGLTPSGETESKGVLYRVRSGLEAESSASPRQAIAGMLLSDREFNLDRAQLRSKDS